ncbi:MAG: UDP-N-acetylglucosamine 2-epimerase [Flavobacteriaceae bacterium]|nr:UDP-N-acetylglucosamine 2-epimerase [Flavobacteriaceae bacterium]
MQKSVRSLLGDLTNVQLIVPLQYEYFVFAMKHSYLVLTDSGGVQEEAPSLGKPVLVMRDTTERLEAVTAGTVQLVGTNKENIIKGVQNLIDEFSKIKKNIQLIIAGQIMSQGYFDKIQSSIHKLNDNRIHLKDTFIPIEQLQVYYNAADIVILPFDKVENSGSEIMAMGF